MDAAFADEHDLVLFAGKGFLVDLAVYAAARDVEQFDASVEVRFGVRIVSAEKFDAVRLVVIQFIIGERFHDVNIR